MIVDLSLPLAIDVATIVAGSPRLTYHQRSGRVTRCRTRVHLVQEEPPGAGVGGG